MVYGVHEREEIVLEVYILLPVGGYEDVLPGLQRKLLKHPRSLDLIPVFDQDLLHGRAGDKHGLAVYPLGQQIPPRMLGIGQIDVRYMIHYLPVYHLRHIPVPAAVPRLHMEDRDLQPLCGYGGQRRVRISENKYSIGLHLLKQSVGF